MASAAEKAAAGEVDYADRAFHRALFTHIEKKVVPTVPPDASPPLPILVYAIRNILRPQPILSLIPRLLHLLAHLEILRSQTLTHIQNILHRHRQYASKPHDAIRLLDHEERDALQSILDPPRLKAQRTVYREVIHGCCLLHIHHLWRTYDPAKDPPLTTLLIDYFPAFFQRDPDIRPQCQTALKVRPWHYAITEQELNENRRVGQQAAQFMLDAAQYVDDPAKYCADHGHDATALFDDLFPAPDVRKIVDAIELFIETVQLACDTVQSVLEDNPPNSL
ncbi:hypothetical protein BV20DRAFT_1057457 [Pilatotrama ljubarskyi]|nr:hypothetical protein BV20DRAFT_1057457 [Pilatotrama ljubarskyi]